MTPRAFRAAAVLAAVAVAPAVGAYERSRDRNTGSPLYWQGRSIPFVVNPGPFAAGGPGHPSCLDTTTSADTAAVEAVRLGFRAWTSAQNGCTDLSLPMAGFSSSTFVGYRPGAVNENLVVFRQGWCTEPEVVPDGDPCLNVDADADDSCSAVYNCFDDESYARNTIALTTVSYNPESGRIYDADMELNGWSGVAASLVGGAPEHGWYFSCVDRASGDVPCAEYGEGACWWMDLQNTVTHEAGHFVGLAHENGDPSVTMYFSASLGDVSKRTLHEDDRAGLCTIYPEEGGSCGSAGSAGLLGAALAAAALLPRLRRRKPLTPR